MLISLGRMKRSNGVIRIFAGAVREAYLPSLIAREGKHLKPVTFSKIDDYVCRLAVEINRAAKSAIQELMESALSIDPCGKPVFLFVVEAA